MTRKVSINGTKLELSKSEEKEVARLGLFKGTDRQRQFDTWYKGAPTPEAKTRRWNVGIALGLSV